MVKREDDGQIRGIGKDCPSVLHVFIKSALNPRSNSPSFTPSRSIESIKGWYRAGETAYPFEVTDH